jgi:hypothetical protein
VAFKEVITRNIGWKIGGLVMALALWLHLATEKIYEKDFSVQIEVTGLPDDLRVDKIEPETAEVAIMGTGKQLLRLAISDDLKLLVDLSNVERPGVYEHKFNLVDIHPIDASAFKRVSFAGAERYKISVVYKT